MVTIGMSYPDGLGPQNPLNFGKYVASCNRSARNLKDDMRGHRQGPSKSYLRSSSTDVEGSSELQEFLA